MAAVTSIFARTISAVYGAVGVAWLDQLPATLAAYAERWSLSLLPPFPNLSYNYVAPAIMGDGSEVVLKLGVPHPELTREIAALRHFDGHGSVRLLRADAAGGALLLERLRPGTTLLTVVDDETAMVYAAATMQRLWQTAPPDHPFPTVTQWAAGLSRLRQQFNGGSGPLPALLVEQAERLFAELIPTMAAPVVLHGDLHHDNILSAGEARWLAIDPKGLVGEPAYETGALLRNPTPTMRRLPDPVATLRRRVDDLATLLHVDRARVRGWGLAQAVLSAAWSIEDQGQGWEWAIACAEILAALPE